MYELKYALYKQKAGCGFVRKYVDETLPPIIPINRKLAASFSETREEGSSSNHFAVDSRCSRRFEASSKYSVLSVCLSFWAWFFLYFILNNFKANFSFLSVFKDLEFAKYLGDSRKASSHTIFWKWKPDHLMVDLEIYRLEYVPYSRFVLPSYVVTSEQGVTSKIEQGFLEWEIGSLITWISTTIPAKVELMQSWIRDTSKKARPVVLMHSSDQVGGRY